MRTRLRYLLENQTMHIRYNDVCYIRGEIALVSMAEDMANAIADAVNETGMVRVNNLVCEIRKEKECPAHPDKDHGIGGHFVVYVSTSVAFPSMEQAKVYTGKIAAQYAANNTAGFDSFEVETLSPDVDDSHRHNKDSIKMFGLKLCAEDHQVSGHES